MADPTVLIGRGQQQFLIKYPRNLGAVGAEPFIIFDIRDSIAKNAPSKGAIGLYIPTTVQVTYNANYTPIKDMIQSGEAFVANLGSQSAWDEIKTTTRQAVSALGADTLKSQTELLTKKIVNPHMTQAFKGMMFRKFTFEFKMQARNVEESNSIRDIIERFKFHMHPDIGGGGGSFGSAGNTLTARELNYPEQFVIGLFTPEDKYLFKIGTCVLENMSIDYAGGGIPSFFDSTGAPVDIRMTLGFTETFQLTKREVLRGL